MKNAKAGFYRVTISLPTNDKEGKPLGDKYYMDDSIKTFMIKVIAANKFIVDNGPEEGESDVNNVENKTEQSAPAVNNSSAKPGDYESGKTSTDNTDTQIDATAKNTRDYLTIISIFCAVAMMIAFAFGIGRAIKKRARQ